MYDDPTNNIGDDGWNMEDLESDIIANGQQNPLLVAKSLYQMQHGDNNIYVFNGNHRLAILKKIGIKMAYCMAPSDADDAEPLSVEEIENLGGDASNLRKFLKSRGYNE
jgi:ParB-like chromosome segregation protein Spo0J